MIVPAAAAARAVATGFRAIALTVDLPRLGRRERDLRAPLTAEQEYESAAFESILEPGRVNPQLLDQMVADVVTWRDLEWLASLSALPLVVKGILTAEDAVLAVEHGAEAIVVSNHGGRQLDGVAATLDALPEVVDAAAERAEVLLDGGIRRGSDVVKALCLGARACMIGRPYLYGLAAAGQPGAEMAINLVRVEIARILTLLGRPTLADLDRSALRLPPPRD